MKAMGNDISSYVNQVIGQAIKIKPWPDTAALPVFLRTTYSFYSTTIISHPCLLIIDKAREENPPTVIKKHLEQIGKAWSGSIIYVRQSISSYARKRLIEHKIPFIVPGNQLYIPDLGFDLREHMNKLRSAPESLSPSAQVLVLYALNNRFYDPFTADLFVKRIGYTTMTFSRVLNELQSIGLAVVTSKGKKCFLEFSEKGRGLWDLALPYLSSPVKKEALSRLSGTLLKKAKDSGLSALSSYSMLSKPPVPAVALCEEDVSSHKPTEIPFEEEGVYRTEVWKYDPNLLSDGNRVDRLSLFLSLRDNMDERVQSALEKMLEEMKW
jgi:DNA-binding HxlR family transcriptional regulator